MTSSKYVKNERPDALPDTQLDVLIQLMRSTQTFIPLGEGRAWGSRRKTMRMRV